jgi:hypothetical protein
MIAIESRAGAVLTMTTGASQVATSSLTFDAICPCRTISSVRGGRSSYGECLGPLSWVIEDGYAGEVALGGLNVALATRYHDDEPGSPWSFVMYLDTREPLAVRQVEIEVSHAQRRQWLRIRNHASVRIRGRYSGRETVTCVIPGHERSGEELIADELLVKDATLNFEFQGNCGYSSRFDYTG